MIAVVGSINMDLVVQVDRHPRPGETVLGSDYQTFPGGKGANQAVAAARLGGHVRFIGRLGQDAFGNELYQSLASEGIELRGLKRVSATTGLALITVNAVGENTIIVSPGANHHLFPSDLNVNDLEGAKVVVTQLEIPLETAERALELGKSVGATTLLNAAPAQNVEPLLPHVDVLVVNEHEAGVLAWEPRNIEEARRVARVLADRVPVVVITLGEMGAVWATRDELGHTPPFVVETTDTTGAGDAFVGALAVALAESTTLSVALEFANAAGALATTEVGARPPILTRENVAKLLQRGQRGKE